MRFGKIGPRPLFKHWTAKDYIQDGLIAMWDGIENAGWGVHDWNATQWKDLTDNHNAFSVSSLNASWGNDHLYFTGEVNSVVNMTILQGLYHHSNGPMTIEQTGIFEEGFGARGFAIVQFRSKGDSNAGVAVGSVVSLPCTSRADTYGTGKNAYFPWPDGLYNFDSTRGGEFIYSASTDGAKWNIYKKGCIESVGRSCGSWSWYNSEIRLLWRISGGTPVDGRVHAIRLYNRAITTDEIAHNYTVDKIRFNLP